MTRRRVLIAGTLCVVSLVSLCPPGAAQVPGSIDDLLQRRAAALMRADKEAFLGTVGPPGSAFHTRQARLFERLSVGLDDYELASDLGLYGDLTRSSDRRRYPGAEEVLIVGVRERLRIAGIDQTPVSGDLFLTFVRRDGRWRIEADDDLDDIGFFTHRGLWDLTPVEVARAGRAAVLHADCAECPGPQPALAQADAAAGVVTSSLGFDLPPVVPVLVPRDATDLSRLLQATFSVDAFVAFALWTGDYGEPPGARVVVNPARFSEASADRARSILVHELVHVATRSHAGPFVPNALDEGLAQLVQYRDDPARIGAAHSAASGVIPENFRFFAGTPSEILAVYNDSLSLAAFIAKEWGWNKLRALYRRIGRPAIAPGTAAYHLDRAVRAVLGTGVDGLERRWASSLGV